MIKEKINETFITILGFFDRNILRISIVVILTSISISGVLEYLAFNYDVLKWINCNNIEKIYLWVVGTQAQELLKIIDSFAIIVGGLSFFLKKWIEKDSENIVFMLVAVLALITSHVFKTFSLSIMSTLLTFSTGILLFIPFFFLIYESLLCSKRRNKRKNNVRIKKRR